VAAPESEILATAQVAETSPIDPQVPEEIVEIPKSKHASLATPAVRGLLKTHKVDILDVNGTGKEGRVLKDDVLKYVETRDSPVSSVSPQVTPSIIPGRQNRRYLLPRFNPPCSRP
jgi:2-oxoisovalerate dehydrogenase E2 component (dihydrolipoyl transacylase)